jgi:acyl-coenzyme A synthetase/AMP-(fatty) acid ligase
LLSQLNSLFSHPHSHSILAWRGDVAVTAQEYVRDVRFLAGRLPSGMHVLNDCHDRYHFAVALGAILVSGKISLLPSTRTAETIRQLRKFAPDACCITDQEECAIDLPRMRYPLGLEKHDDKTDTEYAVPLIAPGKAVAYVFTSGSTGDPIAHRKTWGNLVLNVQTESTELGLNDGRSHAIIGTVPAQHMYGLESTVLIALLNGHALVSGQSFYPADICLSLNQVPMPRVLVTTPVHLRSLMASGLSLPKVSVLVSATAPLAPQLALEAENRFDAPLLEIYGSTETGQIATRRPTQSPEWKLFPKLQMQEREGRIWISGGHVEQPMPMNDVIERKSDDRFLLHGRMADLINIAGKRTSLAFLNHHLNAIPGVEDGIFYMPPETDTGEVRRLQVFVVAPRMQARQVMQALRERIDSAFLPRPLFLVDELPRNSTGKLPQSALAELSVKLESLRKFSAADAD